MTTVGTKYQVVIERRARKALGIAPGWQAVQRVVDGHLELQFFPPEHDESVVGMLRDVGRPSSATTPQLEPHEEEEEAWGAHVAERWGPPLAGEAHR